MSGSNCRALALLLLGRLPAHSVKFVPKRGAHNISSSAAWLRHPSLWRALIYGFSGTTALEKSSRAMPPAEGLRRSAFYRAMALLPFGLVFQGYPPRRSICGTPTSMRARRPGDGDVRDRAQIAAMALLVRLLFQRFGPAVHEWQQVIISDLRAVDAVGRVCRHSQRTSSA